MSGKAKTRRKSNEVPDEVPNFKARSVLKIAPGKWRMRNGHTAKVDHVLALDAGNGKVFPVWFGMCIDCQEPKTWNIGGAYAAVGRHPNDIVKKV